MVEETWRAKSAEPLKGYAHMGMGLSAVGHMDRGLWHGLVSMGRLPEDMGSWLADRGL